MEKVGERRKPREFLTLMEDAIRQPDLAQSVQRYQLAVDQGKVRLNLAMCPGAWLPARMIINTESTVCYNNKLKQASTGMKLSLNNDINSGTMDGGPSRINPPNSHPSNPIHKVAMAEQTPRPALKKKMMNQFQKKRQMRKLFQKKRHIMK